MNPVAQSLLLSFAISFIAVTVLWVIFYSINVAKYGKQSKSSAWTSFGISVGISLVLTLILWGIFYGISQASAKSKATNLSSANNANGTSSASAIIL